MKQTAKLKIERLKISALELHPQNARQGDVGAICQSLEAHGQYKPIVVQRSTMRVCAGNHTTQAAQALGWTEIDAVVLDVDDDQALRILLVDNRANDLATYDNSVLTDLLEHLVRSDYGLEGTGYDGDDLDEMIADQELEAAEVEEDTPPTTPVTPVSKTGDVWVMGTHRLVVGDSTEADTYRSLLNDALVDLVITDPPYNVDYVGKTAEALTIKNDEMTAAKFKTFLEAFYAATRDSMKPGAPIYVFHPPGADGDVFRSTIRNSGLLFKQILIWIKQRFVLGRQDYNWQHEAIIYGWKPGAAHKWYGNFNKSTLLDDDVDPTTMRKDELVQLVQEIRMASDVIREDRPSKNIEHPTMKPVRLIARLVENSSKPGDVVLDPFGGSGSTLMACAQMNRHARLIELDPKYADVILKRFEQATKIKPILESTGKPHTFLD